MASLALDYYAVFTDFESPFSKGSWKKVAEITPNYTEKDSFVLPPTWTGADREIAQHVKDLFEQSVPSIRREAPPL